MKIQRHIDKFVSDRQSVCRLLIFGHEDSENPNQIHYVCSGIQA